MARELERRPSTISRAIAKAGVLGMSKRSRGAAWRHRPRRGRRRSEPLAGVDLERLARAHEAQVATAGAVSGPRPSPAGRRGPFRPPPRWAHDMARAIHRDLLHEQRRLAPGAFEQNSLPAHFKGVSLKDHKSFRKVP